MTHLADDDFADTERFRGGRALGMGRARATSGDGDIGHGCLHHPGMLLRWLVLVSLSAMCGASSLSGCGGTVDCESCGGSGGSSSSSSTGSAACTQSKGEIHGTVSLFGPAADPNSEPAALASVELRDSPDAEPLVAKADDQGTFTVELAPGSWTIGGQSADGYCSASEPVTVQLEACDNLEVAIVLDECLL